MEKKINRELHEYDEKHEYNKKIIIRVIRLIRAIRD